MFSKNVGGIAPLAPLATPMVVHLFLINNIEHFRATVKSLQYSLHPAMVIDSRQKRFVMNMQLIHCVARIKLF